MSKIHIIEHKHSDWSYLSFLIQDWITLHKTAYFDLELPALDQTVISTRKIYVFMRLQSGHYVSLPLRFYSTQHFSASIDAMLKIGKIRVIWSFYDSTNDFQIPVTEVCIFTIDKYIATQYPEVNFRNLREIKAEFPMR
jgi:hypothetical protein